MKVIYDNCRQQGAFRSSKGHALIELSPTETIDDVIEKYVKVERQWFERRYSNPLEVESYEGRRGRFVLLDTFEQWTG